MRLGLIARMDKTGLGNQTRDLFNYLNPHKTLVIDSSPFKETEQHREWYEGDNVKFHKGFLDDEAMEWITNDVDVVFSVEIFYGYKMINVAKRKGVKTVLQYNAEFLDYFNNPIIPFPDVLLAPTMWMIDKVKQLSQGKSQLRYLPMPINREELPFKQRKKIKKLLHVAGMETHMDRNGTDIVIEAMKYVQSDVKLTITTQRDLGYIDSNKIQVKSEVKNYTDLYQDEDMFILPRRYAGLCLPLNESMSVGMIPLMTDCEPQNLFLSDVSQKCLIPHHSTDIFHGRTDITVYNVNPNALAIRIDEMAELSTEQVQGMSNRVNIHATNWSWETMQEKYINVLEEIANA